MSTEKVSLYYDQQLNNDSFIELELNLNESEQREKIIFS